ncbi:hypothetical protein SISNIDRAFT_468373 [Sistotremastrum niveocremeum HHB9708]|uniref:Uncharacterized protein n=1 Tax=Sistotremastrum niveocremeum HHB9708 TaxID=1314777 RepID=A0A164RIS1_9AGAM|nr:hypothetical protein SISNIDRAFT_468373 [Sistotremastrum niveocremeum HHB9708]
MNSSQSTHTSNPAPPQNQAYTTDFVDQQLEVLGSRIDRNLSSMTAPSLAQDHPGQVSQPPAGIAPTDLFDVAVEATDEVTEADNWAAIYKFISRSEPLKAPGRYFLTPEGRSGVKKPWARTSEFLQHTDSYTSERNVSVNNPNRQRSQQGQYEAELCSHHKTVDKVIKQLLEYPLDVGPTALNALANSVHAPESAQTFMRKASESVRVLILTMTAHARKGKTDGDSSGSTDNNTPPPGEVDEEDIENVLDE